MYAPKWILGQYRGVKGHEDFITALSRVRERCPEVRGVIVGGPWDGATWYEQRLRDLGAQTCNGSLYFTGSRNDVAAIYPDLDLAVVPSLSENLGGAAEPLLSGVPVVASNVGGLPDLIHDGETGWLVPSANPGALAAAIEDALTNRHEARSRTARGQALARQLLDVGRTGREVAAIYENVLSKQATLAGPLRPQE
jgi:glycosyltransferase involved in cell wall biosynthesis